MRARVTNLGRGARGFQTEAGATVMVDPGASAQLDLADHPAHDAWVRAREVRIEPEPAADPLLPRAGEGARASRGRVRGTLA